METQRKQVSIYTSALCSGDAAPGTYAVVLRYGDHRKELVGGSPCTSYNRIALFAITVGLDALTQPCDVTVYTNAAYLVDTMNSADKLKHALQKDLCDADRWAMLLAVCREHHVRFDWSRNSPASDEMKRCQELAKECLQSPEMERALAERGPVPHLNRLHRFDDDEVGMEPSLPPPIFEHDPRNAITGLTVCPHGIPYTRICAMCDPDRFREMYGR